MSDETPKADETTDVQSENPGDVPGGPAENPVQPTSEPSPAPAADPVEVADPTPATGNQVPGATGTPEGADPLPGSNVDPTAAGATATSEASAASSEIEIDPALIGDAPVGDAPVAQQPSGGEGDELSGGLDIGSQAIDNNEPAPPPKVRGKIDKFGVAMGTGRRKTSVARVRISDGDGQITVNDKPLDEYFCVERDRLMVHAPLKATETDGKVDVWVRVEGGGTTGQTGAVVLGIARALQARDESLHGVLSDGHYLTRDDRMVERKKYGLAKARRSFQFSKR